ncbi:MAG: glycosyltransferase, partial [Ekhidna sp.]|nr:glycosyltransferase [Ekhidna sp.]
PHLKKQLVSLGAPADKVYINPLLVPLQRDGIIKAKHHKLRFLMIGRFVEKKGFELALTALGQIQSQIPDFMVSIIGYGELEEVYKRIVSQNHLENKVSFLGKKSHDEVKEALYSHDLFLHPSVTAKNGDSEGGAPTIIIEAEAAGLPVIASDHADIPFVMGYHDFLAKQGDLESLKAAILQAVNCSNLPKLIKKGKKHVALQHDFDQSTQYESNIKQIIDNFEPKS